MNRLRPDARRLQQLLQQALEHHGAGHLQPASDAYRAILSQDPRHVDALHFMGVLAWDIGRYDEAADLIGRSLAQHPLQPRAHSNLGNVQRSQGNLDDAVRSYRRAVDLDPNDADLWTNLGVALRQLGRLEEAEAAYRRAFALQPQALVALNNLGNLLVETHRPAEALATFEGALSIDPRYAEAWCNRANALNLLNRQDEAVESCHQALALRPELARAHLFLGNALLQLQRFAEAAEALAPAHAAMPDEPFLAGKLLFARQSVCDWSQHAELLAGTEAKVLAGAPVALAWELLLASDNPRVLQLAARQCSARLAPPAAPLWRGEIYTHERIRVAYLSADLRSHATAYLAARLFELHEPARFEVCLVSIKAVDADTIDADTMHERLRRAPVDFIEGGDLSDAEIAEQLHSRQIDVAVDLQGLTGSGRPGIFAHRPAPVHVNYLGYPGTAGAPFIDYLIADATLIAPGDEGHYDEAVVRLPDSYQVNDNTRLPAMATPSRADAGLPERGFVFACFNKSVKIAPPLFEVWMRLLAGVPGSVLWLFESDAEAVVNLRREAGRRGVAPERLVFAARAAQADHLARHRLADLALDTLPCNAHTTASDALWSGLPMVTCAGSGFAGRVGASLLRAVGLPELVTPDLAAYEALCFALATDRARIDELRQRLGAQRGTHPLFDSERFTRHFENALTTMVQRQRSGQRPAGFDVAALTRKTAVLS